MIELGTEKPNVPPCSKPLVGAWTATLSLQTEQNDSLSITWKSQGLMRSKVALKSISFTYTLDKERFPDAAAQGFLRSFTSPSPNPTPKLRQPMPTLTSKEFAILPGRCLSFHSQPLPFAPTHECLRPTQMIFPAFPVIFPELPCAPVHNLGGVSWLETA